MRSCIFFVFLFLFSCSHQVKRRTDRLSIVQGLTQEKEVEFSIVVEKSRSVEFELVNENEDAISPVEVKKMERSFSPLAVYKVLFIKPKNEAYNLVVYDQGTVIDQRLISGPLKTDSELSYALVSCMNDEMDSHFKIWEQIKLQQPDYLFMIGDNVYADLHIKAPLEKMTEEKLWNRYLDTRMTLPVFFEDKLIPVHAVWDDHDYGINNGGKDFSLRDESKEIFKTFFAQELSSEGLIKGPGVSSVLSLGDFDFYFLDNRSFREEKKTGEHLGSEQKNWLYKLLRENENSPSTIIKGDQFFGGYHVFESYEGSHPDDFKSFVQEMSEIKTPFIFATGDRHMSEIMQFPRSLFKKPSFEITSSPVHSTLFPDSIQKNPWRVTLENAHMNFILVKNTAKDNHWFLEVESIGENGESFFKRELAVFIKDLQNNLNEARKKRRLGRRSYRRVGPKLHRRRSHPRRRR